jgi:hypothetical protein
VEDGGVNPRTGAVADGTTPVLPGLRDECLGARGRSRGGIPEGTAQCANGVRMSAAGAVAAAAGIDWSRPWLQPLRPFAALLDEADPRAALGACAARLGIRNRAGRPIRFVLPDDAGSAAYEAHIAATGRVPTRLNVHDLFNALAWLAFPWTKAALNARQAAELARDGVRATRGPVRDAATLIDESGLLLACDDPAVFDALHRLDWQALLVDGRSRWGREIVPLAFGHALVERLATPYKSITAAVVCVPRGDGSIAAIDATVAHWVDDTTLAPSLLAHLPVLGIPGWWPANAAPSFYADARVFRARRSA